MKIRMKTLRAGPLGVTQPGDTCTLPRDEAATLVALGYAVSLEPEEVREEQKPEVKIEQKAKKK